MEVKKYFLYARKSSEAEEKQVMSIEAQLVELGQYAQRENLNVVERFIESKSAKQPGRTEFNRMLEKVYSSNEPIGVLAWHPDRLARNSVDGGQVIYLIDIKKIASLRFPTFWFEPTPQGLFMLQVSFGQSKYYSDNLSQNVKRGIRQKLRRGEYYGNVPFGYTYNHKIRNIEPDEYKSKVLKRVFELFAEGNHTLGTMREQLKLWGIANRNGKTIGKSSIQNMLTNQTYTGIITLKGETYEGSFEPIISTKLFEQVQKVLKQNSRPRKSKHKHDFPFTDLLKCGECGCSITAQYAKGNGGTYIYYRCSKKKHKCSQGYVREDKMLAQLREVVQMLLLPKSWLEKMNNRVSEWERHEQKNLVSFGVQLETQIEETETKLDKLVNGFLDGLIDKESYLKKKDELIKLKIELSQKRSDFARKGLLWVEPLRGWLEALAKAEKLASSNDLYAVKSFLGKIGTNRIVKDKKVLLDFVEPFNLILKYGAVGGLGGGLCGGEKKNLARNGQGSKVFATQSSVMWSHMGSNHGPPDYESGALTS